MIKKSSSRNHRSKGFKAKHVLQICVLLAICFWLIYQVKHSHDKRKEFDEKDAEVSFKADSVDGILKLGRKELPRTKDVPKIEKHEEQDEETLAEEEDNKHEEQRDEEGSKHEEEDPEEASKHEEEEEEEINKHDEEEQEEEENNHEDEDREAVNKNKDMEDEGRGGGDDETDENEQEKTAGQVDIIEDFVNEEKEREEEKDERENEEKEGQKENENSSTDQNHEEGGRNTHEAREEHYKADDASSAVSHDPQIIGTENEKLGTENSNENSTINIMRPENEANETMETAGKENNLQLKSEEEKHKEGGSSLNNTTAEEKDLETSSYNSENSLHPNSTKAADSNFLPSNNLTEGSKESTNKPAEVRTETAGSVENGAATSVSTESQNITEAGVKTGEHPNQQSIELEHANNASSSNNQPDGNTTVSTITENADMAAGEFSNSSSNEEAATSETIKWNATAEGGSSLESLTTKETTGATQNENSGSEGNHESGGKDESQHDLIDTSDSALARVEKYSRVDLSTLPDSRTELSNTDDAAAE